MLKDSDSDWDDDDDFVAKKINIKIKPIAQVTPSKISASVDELRATVGTWKSMANINLVKPNSRRSHHQSTVQLDKLPVDSLHLSFNKKISITNENNNVELLAPPMAADLLQQHHMDMINPHTVGINSAPLKPSQHQFNQPHQILHQTSIDQSYPVHLPVALAVQECLNVRTLLGPIGGSTTNLVGHIKMAVPKNIIEMNLSRFENQNLNLQISSMKAWSEYQLNKLFVTETPAEPNHHREIIKDSSNLNPYQINNDQQPDCFHDRATTQQAPTNSSDKYTKNLSVDMREVYTYARDLYQRQQALNGSYFLLPELISYRIRSHEQEHSNQLSRTASNISEDGFMMSNHRTTESLSILNPIQPLARWLCDLSETKVRVDLDALETKLAACELVPTDIKNVKICLQVNGGVVSHQSKPPASWSSIESILTWSFGTLEELIQASTVNGVTSCLAKFNLNDGPSTPDDMEVQFSIVGKTLSGTQIVLQRNQEDQCLYRISKQKLEVRTGKFKCEPPCLEV